MKKGYTAPAVVEQRTFAFETKKSGKPWGHPGHGPSKGHGKGKGKGGRA